MSLGFSCEFEDLRMRYEVRTAYSLARSCAARSRAYFLSTKTDFLEYSRFSLQSTLFVTQNKLHDHTMDPMSEKNCLEEISSLVFDANEKVSFAMTNYCELPELTAFTFQVTLKRVSNNWLIKNEIAKDVLAKWIKTNKSKDKSIVCEYLIRGINTKGIHAISVVSEEQRKLLEKKWQNFHSWIYSVETRSNSRKLDLPDYEPIKV